MGPRTAGALIAVAVAALASAGCGDSNPDVGAAKQFHDYPLLWAGDKFEEFNLTHIDLDSPGDFVTFVYGTCEPEGSDEPSCTPPLQLQVSPLCSHLDVVSRAPILKRRSIRGAPVGTIDSAPVLFSRGAQVKAYRGEGSDPALAWRALVALRSVNGVAPVVTATGAIPAPAAGVLEGSRPCTA
jgi:hypothetical protein